MRGAWVCLGIAAAFGVAADHARGWPLLAIGLASIGAAYEYRAVRFRSLSRPRWLFVSCSSGLWRSAARTTCPAALLDRGRAMWHRAGPRLAIVLIAIKICAICRTIGPPASARSRFAR